jgi:hypothetical protein
VIKHQPKQIVILPHAKILSRYKISPSPNICLQRKGARLILSLGQCPRKMCFGKQALKVRINYGARYSHVREMNRAFSAVDLF